MTLIIDLSGYDSAAELEDELGTVLDGADQDSAAAALLSVVQSIRMQLDPQAQIIFDGQLAAIAMVGRAPLLEEFVQ
jgi:hypothetical protein